jgi:hypothetical protein
MALTPVNVAERESDRRGLAAKVSLLLLFLLFLFLAHRFFHDALAF